MPGNLLGRRRADDVVSGMDNASEVDKCFEMYRQCDAAVTYVFTKDQYTTYKQLLFQRGHVENSQTGTIDFSILSTNYQDSLVQRVVVYVKKPIYYL